MRTTVPGTDPLFPGPRRRGPLAGIAAAFPVAVALAFAPDPAAAVALDVSFSGRTWAVGSPGGEPGQPGSWAAYFDDQPITGRIRIDLPDPVLADDTGPGRAFLFGDGGAMTLAYAVRGHDFTYRATPDQDQAPWMFLDDFASTGMQALSFRTQYLVRFDGATVGFDAPAGRLFQSLDPATIAAPASTDGITMRTSFIAPEQRVRIEVRVDRFAFAAPMSPVPEPGLALMMAGGLLAIGAVRCRRRTDGR